MKLALVISNLLFSGMLANPNGAPKSACKTITPGHSGAMPQTSPSPYVLNFKEKDGVYEIKVQNKAGKSNKFKGFFIQALDSGDEFFGEFKDFESSKAQPGNCSDEYRFSTITHTSPDLKDSIEAKWIMPAGKKSSNVTFRATVVKDYQTFWVNIPVINAGNGTQSTGTVLLTLLVLPMLARLL